MKDKRQILIFIALFVAFFGMRFVQENYTFLKNAENTTGTVIENRTVKTETGGENYSPVVRFSTKDGDVIDLKTDFSSSDIAFDVGEEVRVAYDPLYPNNGRIREFQVMYLPLLVPVFLISIFLIIFGVMSSSLMQYNKKKMEELKMRGIRVPVKVKEIRINKNVKVGNKHPFYLLVTGKDPLTQMEKEWKSANIWKNPADLILPGKDLELYIDPQKPKRYMVDYSFLPPEYLKAW